MQAAPLVATDVFTMSSLSVGVRSSAVLRAAFDRGGGLSSTTRTTPHTPSVIEFASCMHLSCQRT